MLLSTGKQSAWVWLLIVAVCSIRACYLYWTSTSELRSTAWLQSWRPYRSTNDNRNRQPLTYSNVTLTDSPDNLFYFIQISDLHLSKYRGKGHTLHFLHFIQSILPSVRPNFVVVTGDLTDAKDVKRVTSQQYIEEWQIYQQAIQQGAPTMPWYDMRGNHDCFDLPSWQSRANLYRTYGKSADLVETGGGIYSWQLTPHYGRYRFVAIDACPKRGPSRPFNFFGYLTSKTMDRLADTLSSADPYNHTFVFSHYPTTTMVFGTSSKGQTFRDLARSYSIYFCGHLHRLAVGLGDVLKWYDPKAHALELELGDMMVHGMYRIVAVDHDLISFVDVSMPLVQIPPISYRQAMQSLLWPSERLKSDPVIMITNPKDDRYALPHKEPLSRLKTSSHIRFLSFFTPQDAEAEIEVDGKRLETEIRRPRDDFWTASWEPARYDDGRQHVLTVRLMTPEGSVLAETSNEFRLDGKRGEIAGGPGEFIISSSMAKVLQGVTLFGIASMLFLLLIAPRVPALVNTCFVGFFQFPEEQPACWVASIVFLLSLVTLPWFQAEFIPSGDSKDSRFGTFYLWGLKFGDEWVPIADTWMFAAGEMWLDVAAFIILFAYQSSGRREAAWFKGLQILYWLWRASELVALAAFYGGWRTLACNMLSMWIVFCGAMQVRGMLQRTERHRSIPVDLDEGKPNSLFVEPIEPIPTPTTSSASSGEEGGTSSTSSSIHGSPHIKSRRIKTSKKLGFVSLKM
ncbi:Metallo-dependent phosphatase-like protein [Syncephalastrum racemosum]|uniref:Metallo-dependent phosphatase-like protein n=1 Tax=Syncephalastrum racemosum TaxID=13706 RepID=A0A1X2HGD3_SYNRA|nr:Metallo-dependent phosphatase-like protein [Syncephalastrum racemosum]